MAAEFTDNLIEFLEDKLKEFNPNIALEEGTAVRDLFIKPFSVVLQPIADAITQIRGSLSLANAAALSDADLDALAANFFVTRKPGSSAIGVVRVFYSQPVDDFLPQGSAFVAANGVQFVSTQDVTITSSGLQLNTSGDLFFQDINVQAKTVGEAGNIPANLIADILTGSSQIVDVTNLAAFTGGTDSETNSDLIARLAIAITFRNLINKPGAKIILLQGFNSLIDVLVVGFGDTFTIMGEGFGPGDGVTTAFQLSQTEDIVLGSLLATVQTPDELVLTGPTTAGLKSLAFFPYQGSTLQLAAGASFLLGTPLTPGTHFTVTPRVVSDELVGTGDGIATAYQIDLTPANAPGFELHIGTIGGALMPNPAQYSVNYATGAITLTPAGVAALGLQQLHAKYTTNATPAQFGLTKAGAALVAGLQLHARYTAGPLDPSLASISFAGVVTFTIPPATGAVLTADFTYYLMRRDRMSGTGITLGDDTFGTLTNVHIGGKVDFYLRFNGLEAREERINGVLAHNYLFAQGVTDPAPDATHQYVPTIQLPIVAVTNVEKVDPGTNLPSGIFLVPGVDYNLVILPNKLNVNMSMRQKVDLNIINPLFLGVDLFFRYSSHPDFANVQAFINDDLNRITTADLLARAPMPIFIDLVVNYSRSSGGPDQAAVVALLTNFINNMKLGKCLSVFAIANALAQGGVQFLQLPISITATKINLDFSQVVITTTNKLDIPPNYQFLAHTITVNEVALESCDAIGS